MPKQGWVQELNTEILQWAADYEQWQQKAIRRGQFPAVIVGKGCKGITPNGERAAPENRLNEQAVGSD